MPRSKCVWLHAVLLSHFFINTTAKDVVSVPQQVSLSANSNTQQISISWDGGAATTFDLLIVRTELNDTVFYETLTAAHIEATGRHEFNWTSAEPLECTSLSVNIRSRSGGVTSEWSSTQILQGNDRPTNEIMQVYPQDKIVPAGANVTFCCIIGEGKTFASFHYISTTINVTRLSRRTFAATVYNQRPSPTSGYNLFCKGTTPEITGSVLFVGYPPLLTDFICETHDLTSAVCQWTEARNTHLLGKRQTRYSINGRACSVVRLELNRKQCSVPLWEDRWTLTGRNPLGEYNMTDTADVRSRVVPLPPEELSTVSNARNATVNWQWKHGHYSSLALVCQVELMSSDNKTKRTFSGVALRSVVLLDLFPYEEYSIKVRCGAQQNFWKWGNWSKTISFQTNCDIPGSPPDLWMFMNPDQTGQVIWKPYEPRQSHGPIVSYEVTLWSPDDDTRHTHIIAPDALMMPVNFSDIAINNNTKVIASIVAKNPAGFSPPASVVLPLHVTAPDSQAVTKVAFTERGFPLSWQSDGNSSCGSVVEWHEASCVRDCSVEWIKVGQEISNVSVKSGTFEPGVRYYLSVYGCRSDVPELLQRWQGYMRELSPSSSVQLSTRQQESSVLLTWSEVPLVHQRGFLLGYNVYMTNGSQLTLLASLSSTATSYTVKGLSFGSYRFTVKAYTSAGEDSGGPASITLEPYADWLILEILATLGVTALALIIVTFICYKKRKWVKGAFYPDIPEPKLPGDWSRSQGPLDIKPSPHSMVHIVEKPEWDSSKEALVVIPEEDEDGEGSHDEPVDTDEPTSLRYYSQVVDDRPIRPRYPDSSASSASSLDSARTDVTYTGIQTSGSSLVFQSDPQISFESHQPDVGPVSSGGTDRGYRPQMHPQPQADNGSMARPQSLPESQVCSSSGYRPQNNWHLDSPEEAEERRSLAPSLGSPTSIASTQFLLPDGPSDEQADEKHQASSAANWFSNLLSSTKP